MISALSEYKDFLPVVTFILGYVLNLVIDKFKKRNRLNSIRKILDHEIARNIEILAISVSKIPKDLSEDLYIFNFAKVVARTSELMTSKVFDTCISDIDKLRSDEIGVYLSFNSNIDALKLY